MALTFNSHLVTRIVAMSAQLFEITPSALLSKRRFPKFIACRHAMVHGLVSSGHFSLVEIALCFHWERTALMKAMYKINTIIRKPMDAQDQQVVELSILVKKFVQENYSSVKSHARAQLYEQEIIPVIRPEWNVEDASRYSNCGVVLREGFLVSAEKEQCSTYPPALLTIMTSREWNAPYVWVKPRIV